MPGVVGNLLRPTLFTEPTLAEADGPEWTKMGGPLVDQGPADQDEEDAAGTD